MEQKPEASKPELSAEQAQAALSSIQESKLGVGNSVRPPLLLTLFNSLCYGTIVLGWCLTQHDNLWALAMWLGGAGFFSSFGLIVYTYRLLGVKINILPKNKNQNIFTVITAIVFASLLIFGRMLGEQGFTLAPYLAATLSALLIFYTQIKFPMGEFIKPEPKHG